MMYASLGYLLAICAVMYKPQLKGKVVTFAAPVHGGCLLPQCDEQS